MHKNNSGDFLVPSSSSVDLIGGWQTIQGALPPPAGLKCRTKVYVQQTNKIKQNSSAVSSSITGSLFVIYLAAD